MPICDIRVNVGKCKSSGISPKDLLSFADDIRESIARVLSTSAVALSPMEVSVAMQDVVAGQNDAHVWVVIHTGESPEKVANLVQRREKLEGWIKHSLHLCAYAEGRPVKVAVWIKAGRHETFSDPPIEVSWHPHPTLRNIGL